MGLGIRIVNSFVVPLYKASGGRVAGHMGKAPIMLLTTTGSRSGKTRTNPVLYVKDGRNFATVASAGGADKNPAWFTNLMRHPDAVLRVNREVMGVRAEKASPGERDRLWALLAAVYPTYNDYARKTKRKIPVVIFRPV